MHICLKNVCISIICCFTMLYKFMLQWWQFSTWPWWWWGRRWVWKRAEEGPRSQYSRFRFHRLTTVTPEHRGNCACWSSISTIVSIRYSALGHLYFNFSALLICYEFCNTMIIEIATMISLTKKLLMHQSFISLSPMGSRMCVCVWGGEA